MYLWHLQRYYRLLLLVSQPHHHANKAVHDVSRDTALLLHSFDNTRLRVDYRNTDTVLESTPAKGQTNHRRFLIHLPIFGHH